MHSTAGSLDSYLAQCYRRDVLGHNINVMAPEPTPELRAAAKAGLARIDSLRLGASLANRDYVSYQNRKALAALLARWEERDAGHV